VPVPGVLDQQPAEDPFRQIAQVGHGLHPNHQIGLEGVDRVASGTEGGLCIDGSSHDLDHPRIETEAATTSHFFDLTWSWPGHEDFIGPDHGFDQTGAGPACLADECCGHGSFEFGVDANVNAVRGQFSEEDRSAGIDGERSRPFQTFEDAFAEVLDNGTDQRTGDLRGQTQPSGNQLTDNGPCGQSAHDIQFFGIDREIGCRESLPEAGGDPGTLGQKDTEQIENDEVWQGLAWLRLESGQGNFRSWWHNLAPELGLPSGESVLGLVYQAKPIPTRRVGPVTFG